jgi:hypothetical protein
MNITTEEFRSDPTRVTAVARLEPVHVTDGGREILVVLAAEEYGRLREKETRALRIAELPADRVRAMLAADLSHLPDDPDEDAAWRF